MSDVQVDETVNSSVQQAIKDQPSQTTTQVDKDEQQAVTELIAGQGKASPSSMRAAIRLAKQLARPATQPPLS